MDKGTPEQNTKKMLGSDIEKTIGVRRKLHLEKIESFICTVAVTVSFKLTHNIRALFPLSNMENETGRFVEMYDVRAPSDGN
jgi:hypothetical protein